MFDSSKSSGSSSISDSSIPASDSDSDSSEETSSSSESSESESVPFNPTNYEEIAWKTLVRDPDAYADHNIKITVEVSQILIGSGFFEEAGIRAYEDYSLGEQDTWLEKEWYITFDANAQTPRVLKGDVVTFYGLYQGVKEMTRALTGAKDLVPNMTVDHYEIIDSE